MDEHIGRIPPLSPQELCKRAQDLWAEVRRTRSTNVGDEFPHMVAIMGLAYAVYCLLDRVDPTATTLEGRMTYDSIRGALNDMGFTPEREKVWEEEDKERVADAQFLMDNGLSPE